VEKNFCIFRFFSQTISKDIRMKMHVYQKKHRNFAAEKSTRHLLKNIY